MKESDTPYEKYLPDLSKDAIKNELISLADLCLILSIHPDYNDIIAVLWKKYQLDLRDMDKLPPDVSTPKKRAGLWYKLLWRLASGEVDGLPDRLKEIKPLLMNDHGNIRLENLDDYFTNYLEIPLPEMLFPSASQDDQTVDQTGQKITRQAVAITEAERLKKEYPGADRRRIHVMVDQFMREHNFKPYSQSHFNRLIKDLKITNVSPGSPHTKKL